MATLTSQDPAVPSLWSADLQARLRLLDGPNSKIAWLYGERDDSTFRYRVMNHVEAIVADGSVHASWFFVKEAASLIARMNQLESLVLCRVRYNEAVAQVIATARACGVRVLFDCDDLVFDPDYLPIVMLTVGADLRNEHVWDWWYAYVSRIAATARICDGGIATTEALAAAMRKVLGNKPVSILPNHLNRSQQEYSESLLRLKLAREARDNFVRIGYFSGSPTHSLDFAIALPALLRLLERAPQIKVRLVGWLDGHEEIVSRFSDRVEHFPFQTWLGLQRLISEVDVNIAPLQVNEFTECKSNLKFFEASAVGTWTIATPTLSYRQSISDGVNGQLAEAFEWDDKLEQAIETFSKPNAKRSDLLAQQAFREYGWQTSAKRAIAAIIG